MACNRNDDVDDRGGTNDLILSPTVLRRPPVFDGDFDEPKQDTSVGKVIAMTTMTFMVDNSLSLLRQMWNPLR
jgi:hypothetical protein